EGESVLFRMRPIGAEAALDRSPVVEVPIVGMKFWTTREALRVNAIVELVFAGTVANIEEALLNIAAAAARHPPMGHAGALGDDVDHAIDGVRSPDCSSGPANYLNTIDVGEDGILHLPVSPGEQGGVNGATVDED